MALLETIVKPPIPLERNLPWGNLTPGYRIVVKGVAPNSDVGFSINLALGPGIGDKRSDTALHFNPRFSRNFVARSFYHRHEFCEEERDGGMPFTSNVPFEIAIKADLHFYMISVDGNDFCDYGHRLPLTGVNTFTIEGKVTIASVEFYGPQTPGVPISPARSYPSKMQPISNPAVPLTTGIQDGLYTGKIICISGTPTGTNRFTVYLQEGGASNADVGFMFDVRFYFGSCTDTIICNHRSRGQWGKEERYTSGFPFSRNKRFDLMIVCEKARFKVAVNNQHFLHFNHRLMPVARFNLLVINGDVILHEVRFQ